MFIPIIIPISSNRKLDHKKLLSWALTSLIVILPLSLVFIGIIFFDMKLNICWYYPGCLLLGVCAPILSKYIITKFSKK